MFNIRERQTARLFDMWKYLGPKRRRLLDESWAGLFRKEILQELPVERMIPFFSDIYGRPTKELYGVLGALLFQQVFDLTDEETVVQMAFNTQWHYALDIPEESDDAKYIAPKTLWSMRQRVTDHNLDTVLLETITDTLAKIFQTDSTKQRMDSVHIKSNMRRLGRIGILVRCLHKFLVNLKRHYKEQFATLAPELVEKYLSEKAVACFSMVKPSEAERTLASVSADLLHIIQHFASEREVTDMYSYGLLQRVLTEQCTIKMSADGEPIEVVVKPAKEVPSDSLQNPSDPDAAYSGHKGQGYHVQIMETYHTEVPEESSIPKLELITHVQVEPANQSDTQALIPALKGAAERDLAPQEVLADSLYGSDENCEAAQEMGVEVVSPVMGAPTEKVALLAEFEFAESGKVLTCPQGHAPVMVKCKESRFRAAFDRATCESCPRQSACPVQRGKKHFYLRYDRKTVRLAQRRAREQTDEFRDRYRFRAGIEGTISAYARLGVKRLRVRGLKAVRYAATLKAAGVNLFRAAVVHATLLHRPDAPSKETTGLNRAIFFFKERFCSLRGHGKKFFTPIADSKTFEPVFTS